MASIAVSKTVHAGSNPASPAQIKKGSNPYEYRGFESFFISDSDWRFESFQTDLG